jgi:predicted ATPase/class 3 adenylate cyclase
MSEVRVLLLTDVVDSTRLSQQIEPAELERLWNAHDRAARDLLPVWRGLEIDKTDGMLLLFEDAADAVGYALAYQRALSTLTPPLGARAGLHTGPVTLRPNSAIDIARGAKRLEVDGLAKAVAARVMSVAAAGQILMSAPAREALNAAGMRIESHGHWRLKGLDEPIELFEVGDAGTAFVPPADADKAYRVVRRVDLWLPAREIRHSLNAERDAFVGRSDALADLSRRIQSGARLVSLLGIGGTGKTRLATRYGWNWLGEFPGGVWFCDLAPARTLDGVAHAVAQGLDVPLGRDNPVDQLGHAIAGRGRCLVILDNFEQVARLAERTVGNWMDRAPQACFLVTTREVLGLPGEDVLDLPPLPLPDGVTLFNCRAQALKPGFQSGPRDDVAIASLVFLLDGLPLAIELAAARTRVMTPRLLLQRIDDRFKLLALKGNRLDRQATLRAAFDWSWDLLSPAEKAALAQLSVFEGGFTLEAAEAVLDLSAFDATLWSVDAVHSLVDKSFVRRRSDVRFDLLVSVQLYAAEHLQTDGRYAGSGTGALEAAQKRHIEWFAAFGPERSTEEGCADLDNLTAACRRAVSIGQGDLAAGALNGASAALMLLGPYKAAIDLAGLVGSVPELTDRAAAHSLLAHARALAASGQAEIARTLYELAISHARAIGDQRCEAELMSLVGDLCFTQGRMDEARVQLEAAMQTAQKLGDRRLECFATNRLGVIEFAGGGFVEALRLYDRALELARETRNRQMQGGVLGNLAFLHAEVGRMTEARTRLGEALTIARETRDRKLEGVTLANLGQFHLMEGRLEEAVSASNDALVMARELGHVKLEYSVLCNLGIIEERLARPEEAQRHFEAALDLARALGDSRSEGQYLGHLGLLHARQARHAAASHCLAAGELLLRAASDPFGLGVLLTSKAEAYHHAGDSSAAEACLVEADAIAIEVEAQPASDMGLAVARVRALLRESRSPAI